MAVSELVPVRVTLVGISVGTLADLADIICRYRQANFWMAVQLDQGHIHSALCGLAAEIIHKSSYDVPKSMTTGS
jgi:hypothetical protein